MPEQILEKYKAIVCHFDEEKRKVCSEKELHILKNGTWRVV